METFDYTGMTGLCPFHLAPKMAAKGKRELRFGSLGQLRQAQGFTLTGAAVTCFVSERKGTSMD